MNLGNNDLIIKKPDGEEYAFMVNQDDSEPFVQSLTTPQVQNGSTSTNPAQAGGVYDVRDSDGDKVIAHTNWVSGAGQSSLDPDGSRADRFNESKCIDVAKPGAMRLAKAVTYNSKVNVAGPICSALGYFWIGLGNGSLQYTNDDGENWTSASVTASPAIDAPIGDIITDGTRVYFCVPTGSSKGIWKSTPGTSPIAFTKYGSDPTTEAIRNISYSGGYLYACTSTGAGIIDATTGVYTESVADFINQTMTSVAMVNAANSVFWVVSQGAKSYVYKLSYSVVGETPTMVFEQFTEYPTGFVATCACGYLNTVYVGGYWETTASNVGMGSVYYASADGQSAGPLVDFGVQPEYTTYPTSPDNDNRVYAITAAAKDLYILTNRAVYRWDIDQGGYSHAFDFLGSDLGASTITWNAGSAYSWDGTDQTSGGHGRFPTGYGTNGTAATSGAGYLVAYNSYTTEGTPTWVHTDGIAKLTSGDGTQPYYKTLCEQTLYGEPSGGEAFDNVTGTTIEIKVGEACRGRCLGVEIGDGVRTMRALYSTGPKLNATLMLLKYSNGEWIAGPYTTAYHGAQTLRFTLKGVTARGAIGTAEVSTDVTMADTSTNHITIVASAGGYLDPLYNESTANYWYGKGDSVFPVTWPGEGIIPNITMTHSYDPRVCAIDSITVNSALAIPAGMEIEVLRHSGIAYNKGRLMAPYAVGSYEEEFDITASSVANPTVISVDMGGTLAGSGLESGMMVTISGHTSSTPAIDGNHVATVTGDRTFTIPVNVSDGGVGGTVTWNPAVGFAVTSDKYAEEGYLAQSETTFHAGSVLKDYRYIDVSHQPIPSDSNIMCAWRIDGEDGAAIGTTSGNRTRFVVDKQGYSIQSKTIMHPDSNADYTPEVNGANVMWNFVKTKRNQYKLDCRRGAGDDLWQGDPQTAIDFLKSAANKRCTFTDRLSGTYTGLVENVIIQKANFSRKEGVSGLVTITVREEEEG